MSGDMTDSLPLPDNSGIIPRVLYALFDKVGGEEAESSVKCSFIELYNEELRDLLSVDDNLKLKIYEDTTRKEQNATYVQGMEECHIKTASRGLQLLKEGSHKRQVAATKCNDLSSRSHTIFTITVYMKRTSESGEEFISAGKLNLVDLAGSENIQRSGAENKRAAEAGLINKSLLTLGRVINALVDRSSHIPYRESKLTRLLQDSLGGRTKTCIIATLSPAKSNLEETISTLDYAFRAKNIRNKPQINQMVQKKTLLKEFTAEIEKLKGELIAARQRNGIYLTQESFEEMTTESESRRILGQEQRDKIETMEVSLRNKTQELFALTSTFNHLKKDNDVVRATLEGQQGILEKTELILANVQLNLAEETTLREAYQETEEVLRKTGECLITTIGRTTSDIEGLHLKLRRKSDVQSTNRLKWVHSQERVSSVTQQIEQKMLKFDLQHRDVLAQISRKLSAFVDNELQIVESSRMSMAEKSMILDQSDLEINGQTEKVQTNMNEILEGIIGLRNDMEQTIGRGLEGLSSAAQRISAGVITELETFHTQLHSSYSSLGRDFKTSFDDLLKHLNTQEAEAERLRQDLIEAGTALQIANRTASERLDAALAEERQRSTEDRRELISQMASLINSFGDSQSKRMEVKVGVIQTDIFEINDTFKKQQDSHNRAMEVWLLRGKTLVEDVLRSRENVKSKIKKDWIVSLQHGFWLLFVTNTVQTANELNTCIQTTTRSVHEETNHIVNAQMKHVDVQLQALDGIVNTVRTLNGRHHEAHVHSLKSMGTTVKESYSNISERLAQSHGRLGTFRDDISAGLTGLRQALEPVSQEVNLPLSDLRSVMVTTSLQEYECTGDTPPKVHYRYPTVLPTTGSRELLIETHSGPDSFRYQGSNDSQTSSPIKAAIFSDAPTPSQSRGPIAPISPRPAPPIPLHARHASLREIDVNIPTAFQPTPLADNGTYTANHASAPMPTVMTESSPKEVHRRATTFQPPLKRQNTGAQELALSLGPGSKLPKRLQAEGRENIPPTLVGARTLRPRVS